MDKQSNYKFGTLLVKRDSETSLIHIIKVILLNMEGAQGIVIVYDVTNSRSFEDVTKFWMAELSHYADENVKLLLLGNKIDLANEETR